MVGRACMTSGGAAW